MFCIYLMDTGVVGFHMSQGLKLIIYRAVRKTLIGNGFGSWEQIGRETQILWSDPSPTL